MSLVRIKGKITNIKFGKPSTILIENKEENKNYQIITDFFIEGIKKNYLIECECNNINNKLFTIYYPYVTLEDSKKIILTELSSFLKENYNTVILYYNEIKNTFCYEEDILIDKLYDISSIVEQKRFIPVTFKVRTISLNTLKEIYNFFYKRLLTKLTLLKISLNEIEESKLNLYEFYSTLISNPFKLFSLNLEKTINLTKTLSISFTDEQLECGKIIRGIFYMINNYQNTSCNTDYMIKKFPSIIKYKQILENEYGVVFELRSVYLFYYYKVEKHISKFIKNLLLKNKLGINENNIIINDNCDEEQKNAIKSSLINPLTIISGSAGTGKCLALNTKILLFNGKIKKVQDIKKDDYLMGPDSKKRKVLSICKGNSLMYRIIPSLGISFICNDEHILVLKINNIVKEIPIKDFIKLSYDLRKSSYLFHQKIIFYNDSIYIKNPYKLGLKYYKLNKKIPDKIKYINSNQKLLLIKGYLKNYNNRKLDKNLEFIIYSLGLVYKLENNKIILYKGDNINFKIKELKNDNYYGFELDNDKKFLLSDCLVSHNTTCIKEIYNNLIKRNENFAFCSFTGKAVSRIKEILELNIKEIKEEKEIKEDEKNKNICTIHSLLYKMSNFSYILIDEVSLLYNELFYKLIIKNPKIKQLVLIGDINQLPSLSSGNLFKELLNCNNLIPTFQLKKNYRVYIDNNTINGIIYNSNLIIDNNKENYEQFELQQYNNFLIIDGGIDIMEQLISKLKSINKINLDNFIIISPLKKFNDPINKLVKQIFFNSNNNWDVGDKVMLNKNMNDYDIYNGEIGEIKEIKDDYILVSFKGIIHLFYLNKTNEKDQLNINLLNLAYCITTHKSQGSQWDYVFIFLSELKDFGFFNKNLIYTSITRTIEKCFIICDNIELLNTICTKNIYERKDNLGKRLYDNELNY